MRILKKNDKPKWKDKLYFKIYAVKENFPRNN